MKKIKCEDQIISLSKVQRCTSNRNHDHFYTFIPPHFLLSSFSNRSPHSLASLELHGSSPSIHNFHHSGLSLQPDNLFFSLLISRSRRECTEGANTIRGHRIYNVSLQTPPFLAALVTLHSIPAVTQRGGRGKATKSCPESIARR